MGGRVEGGGCDVEVCWLAWRCGNAAVLSAAWYCLGAAVLSYAR